MSPAPLHNLTERLDRLFERNVVYRSTLTGQFYFAPKVRVLDRGIRVVVGRKYDITAQISPYLLKRWRLKSEAK